MTTPASVTLPTKRLDPKLVERLNGLEPGQKIIVIQAIRVGSRKWSSTSSGVFRSINYLATGISTDRLPDDDLVVPMVHFTKENGEHTSIAIDENTQLVVD